tara:strand:- start:12 stop:269 length:258 start_codon:yes stop_codon:yes gene_type:complete
MQLKKKETLDQRWNREARKHLQGRTIVAVRYMTEDEAKEWGWHMRPVMFILDNDTSIIVQRDDEGNDGGALLGLSEGLEFILPVL